MGASHYTGRIVLETAFYVTDSSLETGNERSALNSTTHNSLAYCFRCVGGSVRKGSLSVPYPTHFLLRSIPTETFMMYSLGVRRRISAILLPKKIVTHGLNTRKKAIESAPRPVHRQFGTLFTSSSSSLWLRQRYAPQAPAPLRNLQVRAISYSSIPRFILRIFRVPIACAIIGAGVLFYVDYKSRELRDKVITLMQSLQDTATGLIDLASGGIKSVLSRIPGVKVSSRMPEVKLPDKVNFEELRDKSTALIPSLQDASDGIKSRIPEVKLPDIKTPQFLKGLFTSMGDREKSRKSDSQGESSTRRPPEENVAIAAPTLSSPPDSKMIGSHTAPVTPADPTAPSDMD